MQIVPPQGSLRHSVEVGQGQAEESPTLTVRTRIGPGGADNFRNVAGSQISYPHVTNVYIGDFWGDEGELETFCKAIVENGYLDPLRELGYGTGSGEYLGSVHFPQPSGNELSDQDARQMIRDRVDSGALHADNNTLFLLILPRGFTSKFTNEVTSCNRFCGYHDVVTHCGIDIAYAVIPPPGNEDRESGDLRRFTAIYAHLLAEACTDKVPGKGWISADGMENGDLEAWDLYHWGPSSDPKRFVVQGYYTNERGNTIGAWREEAIAVPNIMAASETLLTAASVSGPKKNSLLAEARADGDTMKCKYSDGHGGSFIVECKIPWGGHCPNPWTGEA